MPWRVVQFLQFLSLLLLAAALLLIGFRQPVSLQLSGLRLALPYALLLSLGAGIVWGALLVLPLTWRAQRERRRARERAATLERTLNATLQARLAESSAPAVREST